MGRQVLEVLLLVATIMAASWAGALVQSGCLPTVVALAPCVGFIQGSASTPSASCCTNLASVVQSQPACLCQVLNTSSAPFGIPVNRTQALALPGDCNVQTPPVSQCNAVPGPAVPPAEAPPPPSPSLPTTPPTPPTTPPGTPGLPIPQTPPSPTIPGTPPPAGGGGTNASPPASGASASLAVSFCLLFVASHANPGFF